MNRILFDSLKMKLILLGIVLLLPFLATSQMIEVTPITGYMFGGSIRGYEGQASIDNKINYGGSISWEVQPLTYMELSYLRQDSRAQINRFGVIESTREFDLATSYYHIGVLREGSDGDIRPFGTVSVGATVFNPKESGRSTATFFSTIFGAGLKANIADRFGLRMQGRLLVPLAFSAGSIWCGTGGCGVGYGTYATLVQGDFSIGIIVSVGE